MTGLHALWIPMVVSAVLVFLASSVIHMLSPWHRSDYPKSVSEDQVLDALRPINIPPGDYMMPRPSSRAEMSSPEFAAKVKRGPVIVMTVFPAGGVNIGRNMIGWFVYTLVISALAGYLGSRTLHFGAEYMRVFCVVGLAAFLGYAAALWQMSIWYNRAWSTTIKSTIDGVIYASLTAGTFGWLWPR